MRTIFFDQKGQVFVLAPFIFMVLLLLLGLAIDTGYLVYQKWRMQNAVDLSALAGAQYLITNPDHVVQGALDNGVQNGLNGNTIHVAVDQQTVTVTDTEAVSFYFMPLFGIPSKDVTVSATAKVENLDSPVFQYAIFSANTSQDLKFPGSNNIVDGKLHNNGNLIIPGSGNTFNQVCEVTGTITADQTKNHFQQIVNPATIMPLPEFYLDYYKLHASKLYTGNQTFSNLNFNGIVFVDGSVTVSGNQLTGNGTIVATGTISISSSQLQYTSNNDLIAFYGVKGIAFSGSNGYMDGFFYAPNGTIRIPGSRNTFYGSLIGQAFAISGSANHYMYDSRIQNTSDVLTIHLIQ